MQLEFHQLERRWEHLRVRRPERQRRLLASLAASDAIVVGGRGQPGEPVNTDSGGKPNGIPE